MADCETVTNTQPTREQSILTMVTYSICTSSIRFLMGMSSENKIAVCVHVHKNTHIYTKVYADSTIYTYCISLQTHSLKSALLALKQRAKYFKGWCQTFVRLLFICQSNCIVLWLKCHCCSWRLFNVIFNFRGHYILT